MASAIQHGAKAPVPSATGTGWIAAAIVAAWFAVIVALGAAEIFVAGPAGAPLPLFAAIVVPPILFAIAYAGSAGVREFALGLALRVLTAMQAWRVIGLVFLAFYAFDMLPGIFAWPAGLGDRAQEVHAELMPRRTERRVEVQSLPNPRRSLVCGEPPLRCQR